MVDHGQHQLGQDHLVLDAERVGPPHGPADDAPQHVAAALVGRDDAVVHQEGHGAGVVGHHPQGDVGLGFARPVGAAGERLGHGDEGP